MQYNYDQDGAIFSYFIVTLFTIILVPYTISTVYSTLLFDSKRDNTFNITCLCDACKIKIHQLPKKIKKSSLVSISYTTVKHNSNKRKWVVLLVGWLLFGTSIYQAFTLHQKEDILWDPYIILGVDQTADERDVKRAFKKLSLQFHPDKVLEAEKEEAEKKFVDISKAYKVLTDEEARKLYDEFGHPDGKQAFQLGLALPAWLIEKENSGIVLLVYTVAFGIILPFIVARWWTNAKVVNKNKILNESMGVFYRDLKESTSFRSILEVMSRSLEYQGMKDSVAGPLPQYWQKYEKEVMGNCEKSQLLDYISFKKNTNLNDVSRKIILLLCGYLLRIKPENALIADLQDQVVEYASLLLHGLLQIAQSRNWVRSAVQILDVMQCVSQAIPPGQSELLQLPFIDSKVLKSFYLNKKKIDSMEMFLKLDIEKRLELLSPHFTNDQIKIIQDVAAQYPRLEIAKAEYSVYGEPVIVPGSLVTMSIKFRCIYGNQASTVEKNNEIPDPEVEKEQKKWWDPEKIETRVAHTPFFPVIKKPSFSVILANGSIGRLIGLTKVYGTNKDHVCRIQFQAPPDVGSWTFQVYVKSDTFIGVADARFDLKLIISPTSELPEENFDDTISEPEENIVGYEKPVKAKKKKPMAERGEYDDSSDSSDEDAGNNFDSDNDSAGPGEDFIE